VTMPSIDRSIDWVENVMLLNVDDACESPRSYEAASS